MLLLEKYSVPGDPDPDSCFEEVGTSKLSIEAVISIRRAAREWGKRYGRKALAQRYGVSESLIKQVVAGRVWA